MLGPSVNVKTHKQKHLPTAGASDIVLVGARGFEPPTLQTHLIRHIALSYCFSLDFTS
jgi:hypothetical protein